MDTASQFPTQVDCWLLIWAGPGDWRSRITHAIDKASATSPNSHYIASREMSGDRWSILLVHYTQSEMAVVVDELKSSWTYGFVNAVFDLTEEVPLCSRDFLSVEIERGSEMTDQTLLGVCGLYCGACYHYRASFPEGKHLLEKAKQDGKTAEEFTCQGCRSGSLYIHPGCRECQLRDCAQDKQVLHCGLCPDFPCAMLEEFRDDGHIHHLDIMEELENLRKRGADEWLKQQEKRWQCPQCGANYSWYETSCVRCGASLESYGLRKPTSTGA